MRKSKYDHEIVEKKIENCRIVTKIQKNNDFYDRVIIAIKQNAL